MRLSEFSYQLPPESIAQRPLDERDASRMLIVDRRKNDWEDSTFRSLPERLRGDELIVVNNARVIPARLFGRRAGVRAEKPSRNTRVAQEFLSSEIEVLLTRQMSPDEPMPPILPATSGASATLLFRRTKTLATCGARVFVLRNRSVADAPDVAGRMGGIGSSGQKDATGRARPFRGWR